MITKRKKQYKKKSSKKDKRPVLGPEHKAILEDPVKFAAICWPGMVFTEKQKEILYSLRDNVETFVHAANEVGKDFITSVGVVWFACSRSPVRIVTSSSGETQLKLILWSEIKQRIATSRLKLPFKMGAMSIKLLDKKGEEVELSYIQGHVTKSVENFQGHHLDHDKPRVLAVFDEASGVGDEFKEAADSWAHRILVIGNPLNTLNFFYRDCKGGDIEHADGSGETGLLRKVIHISCHDSPNVALGKQLAEAGLPGPYPSIIPGVLSYAEWRRRLIIWDKVKQHMRLEGHFYEGDETLVYPPEWLDLAESQYGLYCPLGYEKSNRNAKRDPATAMGVDAGAGRDLSCWTMINAKRMIKQYAVQTPNTMDIVSKTIHYMKAYRIPASKIAFDAGGGGKQIADRLREIGHQVRTVYFGESPSVPKGLKVKQTKDKEAQAERKQSYKNRRAEMYDILRQRLDPSVNDNVFGIPVELYELRKELAIMPLLYDDEGKMLLPPKDKPATAAVHTELITIKKLLGHSPDRADSLVLATFAQFGQPARRSVGAL